MGLSMANTVRLMSFQFAVIAILLSSLQYKTMSPRLFALIETTVMLIGTSTLYEGMPPSAFDWSY
jgi:hypothetical protein